MPNKPSNPNVPDGYQFYDKTGIKTWGNIDGGWGHYTTTDLTMSEIRTGKSFGVLGTGKNDGVAWATANYGLGVNYGAAKNNINTGVTPNVCYPHYMVMMVAPKTTTYTMTAIKVKFGAYAFVADTELTKPTTPTKATDVNSPISAGASKLFASAMIAASLIIF